MPKECMQLQIFMARVKTGQIIRKLRQWFGLCSGPPSAFKCVTIGCWGDYRDSTLYLNVQRASTLTTHTPDGRSLKEEGIGRDLQTLELHLYVDPILV